MFEPNPKNQVSSSSNKPEWLSALRPASASVLQASVFYQAGYEAARREQITSMRRRTNIFAIATSALIASVSGALFFQLGKQNPQAVAVSQKSYPDKPLDAPQREREQPFASTRAIRDKPVDASQSLIPQWFQSQFRQVLPIANSRVSLLGPGVELGQVGVQLDRIIVLNSAANIESRTNPSADENEPTEPQSLRAMRDNQIKSLMESLL